MARRAMALVGKLPTPGMAPAVTATASTVTADAVLLDAVGRIVGRAPLVAAQAVRELDGRIMVTASDACIPLGSVGHTAVAHGVVLKGIGIPVAVLPLGFTIARGVPTITLQYRDGVVMILS